MSEPSDALDQSLLAFCAIQIRVAGEDSITYKDIAKLYNNALVTIIKELDKGPAVVEETLGAIVTLSTCEVTPSFSFSFIFFPHIKLQNTNPTLYQLFIFIGDQSLTAHAYGASKILLNRDVLRPSPCWDRLITRVCIICVCFHLTSFLVLFMFYFK